MGWWSKDIMGGDSPLDVEDGIYDICRVEKFLKNGDSYDRQELTKEILVENQEKILEFVRSHENNDYYDESAIAYQVFGVIMMKAGAPISNELKIEIHENSKTDSWAQQDSERRKIVENFHKMIEIYDETPIVINSKGLFEAIAEHLSNGNTGLVNKGKDIG